MLCTACRKVPEMRTRWEKFRAWIMHWFHEEMLEWGDEKFTQGFGEGYKAGHYHAKEMYSYAGELGRVVQDIKDGFKDKLKLNTSLDAREVLAGMANEKGETVGLTLGGEKLSDEAIKELKGEIDYLKKTRIWSILNETVRKLAIDKAINQSTDFEQVLSGKMMLHDLGIINSIIGAIDSVKIVPSKIITPNTELKA